VARSLKNPVSSGEDFGNWQLCRGFCPDTVNILPSKLYDWEEYELFRSKHGFETRINEQGGGRPSMYCFAGSDGPAFFLVTM